MSDSAVIKFNGRYLSIIEDGVEVKKFESISGRLGHQDPAEMNVRNIGPLPEGEWKLKQTEYQEWAPLSAFQKILGYSGAGGQWQGGVGAWGQHRVWLEPEPGTETFGRDNFSIHGGADPGSAGCIDMLYNAPEFFEYFRNSGKDLKLVVDYGDYDGSTHPWYGHLKELDVLGVGPHLVGGAPVSLDDALKRSANKYLQDRAFEYGGNQWIGLNNQDSIELPDGNGQWQSQNVIVGSKDGQSIPLNETDRAVIIGSNQADMAHYGNMQGGKGLIINLGTGTTRFKGESAVKDYLGTAIGHAHGSNFGDVIIGNELDNTLVGGDGVNFIEGVAGNNTITGGPSHNYIRPGSAGNHTLTGGGKGSNVFDVGFNPASQSFMQATITDFKPGVDFIYSSSSSLRNVGIQDNPAGAIIRYRNQFVILQGVKASDIVRDRDLYFGPQFPPKWPGNAALQQKDSEGQSNWQSKIKQGQATEIVR